jgi:hypothetical protein
MRIRKRSWILKRIVLGLAVMALVVPGAAKARVDEGVAGPGSGAPPVASSGFEWGDAGIGAGVLAGVALLGGAALVRARQLGRPLTA